MPQSYPGFFERRGCNSRKQKIVLNLVSSKILEDFILKNPENHKNHEFSFIIFENKGA